MLSEFTSVFGYCLSSPFMLSESVYTESVYSESVFSESLVLCKQTGPGGSNCLTLSTQRQPSPSIRLMNGQEREALYQTLYSA